MSYSVSEEVMQLKEKIYDKAGRKGAVMLKHPSEVKSTLIDP